ncbi:MAG: GTPase Era [Candidatus Atelocyanobacterium thalassa]|uniref:GTPase Era n=1 Tax=Candidatus Atelocyanobacterium thalassa isolate SIO64986 TaxID=1527444 RepID=A0A086CHF0_9CHRO|nr:MAG: GTP-binding protein Era [Candidatus Atelocyanobacterium thalassa isolate SIO64986]
MASNVNSTLFSTIPITPKKFKSGFIGIIGRPNVGKSTIMNQLVGQKIVITSNVSQTTRNRLKGILTTDTAQMIFVDTPGIHKPHHNLGKIIVKNAKITINSVDIILLVVDSSTLSGGGDRYIIDLLKNTNKPVIVGLNKSDKQTFNYEDLDKSYLNLIKTYEWPVVKFSALTKKGLKDLQNLLTKNLGYGPYYYHPDLVTDQPEKFIIQELIREQVLCLTRQEIPHSVAIVIEKIEETSTVTKIFAAINVERNSQKGIIIGNKGNMLKSIGAQSRMQIQKLIAGEVYLKLFVKVEPNWRFSNTRLADFGYGYEE